MAAVSETEVPAGDEAIRAVVTRLARPHPQGGDVIERAAILAEGRASGAIVAWIIAHSGEPEAVAPAKTSHGLYGGRLTSAAAPGRAPLRYVLPAGALR
jgi:hypothetical protein